MKNNKLKLIQIIIAVLFLLSSNCISKNKSVNLTVASKNRHQYIKNSTARSLFKKYRENQKNDGSTQDAYKEIKKLYKKYPKERIITITYAALHGDDGQKLSLKKEIERKREAVDILKPLLIHHYKNKLEFERVFLLNEFYYHSGDYKSQMKLGEWINKQGESGNFSLGVGAAMLALKNSKHGRCLKAKELGLKSKTALEELIKKIPVNNPFYLSALMTSGKCSEAKRYFTEISKTKDYKDFKRWYTQFNPDKNKCCNTAQKTY